LQLLSRDSPHTDNLISVSREQGLAIGGPGEAQACRLEGLVATLGKVGDQVGHECLGLQIPDLDAVLGGSAQPVSVGREDQRVDNVVGLQRVQVLAFIQVPEHDDALFASRCTERAIGGDSDGVDVTSVSAQVALQLAVVKKPDLDHFVPAAGDDDGGGGIRRKSYARDPLSMTVLLDDVFALTKGVPQTDSLVTGAGHDLSVVR